MITLEVEPRDLGQDVRAVGLDLAEGADRDPVRGEDAARVWSMALPAIVAQQPWVLDFFSHLDRVRDFCERHQIAFKEASQRSIVIPAPEAEKLESLLDRFQAETFGARAGGAIGKAEGDTALEGDLARRGVDAYHGAFRNYYFCAVCSFEDGSLVLLTEKLWAGEVIRRVRPTLAGFEVEVRLPA